ncbi:hypothetical protein Micbo1qcDRAFT_158304, partial [Microdochium bolleyi]
MVSVESMLIFLMVLLLLLLLFCFPRCACLRTVSSPGRSTIYRFFFTKTPLKPKQDILPEDHVRRTDPNKKSFYRKESARISSKVLEGLGSGGLHGLGFF